MNSPGALKTVILAAINVLLIILLFNLLNASPTENEVNLPSTDSYSPSVIPEYEDSTPLTVAPRSIDITLFSDYITVGYTIKADVYVSPSDAAVNWKSANPSIAQVDSNGNISGIAKGSTYISASTDNGLCSVREIRVMNPGLVFLSPSRQTGNMYVNKMTDESTQAFLMSGSCKKKLEAVGLEVYECPIEYTLEQRGKHAADMNAKCYVAIHTNAGGVEHGTMSFFNRRSEASVRLAKSVYETVAPITPDIDSGVKNGVKNGNTMYKEIQFPYEANVPSTLLEVDYHDKESSALWLIQNAELIGYSIADGIMRFMYETY